MTQLTQTKNKDVEVFRTRIVKYSAGTLTEHIPVMLLDVSGSMEECINGRRKVDMLKDAVEAAASGIETYCFSSSCVKTKIIPQPQGGTDLADAFCVLKNVAPAAMHLILVSDGMPDNVENAIYHGKRLQCPINVIYIGVQGDSGESFMRRLAEDTGGKWLTVDTLRDQNNFQQKLSSGLEKLLLCSGGN